ncbi:RH-like protein [Enhydra lutris kenyoni]|uniref:RH-like protein n=1 Tax=Enhydra lutris kenyoni TaxID=391180 RepID=A0A2Y9KL63_ENHLU|nr:RH-like protein [Enhydra lutris kenyoni]
MSWKQNLPARYRGHQAEKSGIRVTHGASGFQSVVSRPAALASRRTYSTAITHFYHDILKYLLIGCVLLDGYKANFKGLKVTQTEKRSSLFTMLGTLFLWIFWPSFNSALLDSPIERKNAVFSTYYALAASTVTAISVSVLAHSQRKINMTHIHNAVLAGGVAVGASCHLIASPWLAMVLGFMAGLISIGGALCLPGYFNQVLGTHDTCGVHYTFGLPGLLGGITYILLIIYEVNWTTKSISRIDIQLFFGAGTLSLAMASGLIAGVLTGLVLSLKIFKAPPAAKHFDDQAFWEFPHLATGF